MQASNQKLGFAKAEEGLRQNACGARCCEGCRPGAARAAVPVGCDEGFFNPIAMMHIQVQIQHPCMVLQELQNGKHQVVHIAEACTSTMLALREHVVIT